MFEARASVAVSVSVLFSLAIESTSGNAYIRPTGSHGRRNLRPSIWIVALSVLIMLNGLSYIYGAYRDAVVGSIMGTIMFLSCSLISLLQAYGLWRRRTWGRQLVIISTSVFCGTLVAYSSMVRGYVQWNELWSNLLIDLTIISSTGFPPAAVTYFPYYLLYSPDRYPIWVAVGAIVALVEGVAVLLCLMRPEVGALFSQPSQGRKQTEKVGMVKCPICGTENPRGANFCMKCAAPLGQPDAGTRVYGT